MEPYPRPLTLIMALRRFVVLCVMPLFFLMGGFAIVVNWLTDGDFDYILDRLTDR